MITEYKKCLKMIERDFDKLLTDEGLKTSSCCLPSRLRLQLNPDGYYIVNNAAIKLTAFSIHLSDYVYYPYDPFAKVRVYGPGCDSCSP